ncbi:anaerobic sulfatase maturase [Billgrantia azerbaijanica]|nr:anaerobic sulfatase maturase [Halomonas azerbaijanica]
MSSTLDFRGDSHVNSRQASRPFHLLIKPIGPLCNLDCDYCFYLKKEDQFSKGRSFRMTDAVLERLTRSYIEQQPEGTREVNFAWQGGEPTLMGLEFFRKAVALQRRYRRPGMTITNALQTNGTLLNRAWAQFLKEEGFLVGISVDGPMRLHDQYRKDKKGRGSYSAVTKGVEWLRRHEVAHNFLCVVNRRNADHPNKVYRKLKALGAEHIQFIPLVEHDLFDLTSHPGSAMMSRSERKVSERSVGAEQYGKFLNRVFDEWHAEDIGRVSVQNFEATFATLVYGTAHLCVNAAQCGRNLIAEHDGSIYSCDHFVYPSHKLGNLTETALGSLVDSPRQIEFGRSKTTRLTSDCQRCPYRKYCHGGCPAHRIQPKGTEPHYGNYLCQGYKAYYRHTLDKFKSLHLAFSMNNVIARQ